MSTRQKRAGSWRVILLVVGALILGAAAGVYFLRDTPLIAQLLNRAGATPAVAAGVQSAEDDLAEACGVAISGSNTIGEHLAPAVVSAFLRYNKYEVGPPEETAPGEIRIKGLQADWKCTVDIRSHGSGTAFKELLEGTALIGMSSRPIKDREIVELQAAGAGDFATDAGKAEHVIALDGIAIVVHPSNPIREMRREDVKRIFTGQIKEWSELGAPFGAIRVYARNDVSGTFQFFHETVLEEDPRWDDFKPAARRYESSSELVAAVGGDPQAIGFVGVAYVGPGVRALDISDGGPAFAPTPSAVRSESYPISRRLYLYVRPQVFDDNNFVNALINHFKSAEAYALVQELSYVSLRHIGPDIGGPAEPGVACRAGTPEAEVYRTATIGAQRLDSVIRFTPRSDTLDSLARDDIARAFPTVRDTRLNGGSVRFIGHSDSAGDDAKNRELARERAEIIRAEFERQGVLGIEVESAGEMCPVASNETDAGRRSNRRVEIWVTPRG